MRRVVLILSLAAATYVCAASANFPQGAVDPDAWKAFHRNDIREWAARSGLSVAVVGRILRIVGRDGTVEDDGLGDPYSIQSIDSRSLAGRGQIFIALTGSATGHALAVYVVGATPPYRLIWNAEGIDEGECIPENFYTDSLLGEVTASVSAGTRILVKIPISNGETGEGGVRKSMLVVASYRWNGKTYIPEEERLFDHYRWNGRDYVEIGAGVVKECR